MRNEFETHLRLIDALENGDMDTVSQIVREDTALYTFESALLHAARHLSDINLVERLLDLPGINIKSNFYRRALTHTLMILGGHEKEPDFFIVGILFDRLKNDSRAKNETLSFIFSTAAAHGPDYPNADIARLLIRNGATCDDKELIEGLSSQQIRNIRKFQNKTKR